MRVVLRALAVVAALATLPLGAQQPRATLILVNGRVLTVDSADRVAQAVGIAGNRIVAVGSTAEVEQTAASTSPAARSPRDFSTPTPTSRAVGPTASTSST
jgi:hypothetical protein